LADRKRVAEIYIQAAQENLDKGWYSGDAIDKALFLAQVIQLINQSILSYATDDSKISFMLVVIISTKQQNTSFICVEQL